MLFAGSLGLDYLSPNAPLGIFILVIGFFFSGIIGYVLYSSVIDKSSIEEKIAEEEKKEEQREKISKLYPPKILF